MELKCFWIRNAAHKYYQGANLPREFVELVFHGSDKYLSHEDHARTIIQIIIFLFSFFSFFIII